MSETVILKCVKQGSKLRVRIISPGFNQQANCQFPRAIRLEGRKYAVPRHAITFAEGPRHKFFYRVSKSYIKIIEGETELTEDLAEAFKNIKIYENTDDTECIVCMSEDKSVVFAPCGHYCSCESCAIQINHSQGKCPICRTRIQTIVKRDQIQT